MFKKLINNTIDLSKGIIICLFSGVIAFMFMEYFSPFCDALIASTFKRIFDIDIYYSLIVNDILICIIIVLAANMVVMKITPINRYIVAFVISITYFVIQRYNSDIVNPKLSYQLYKPFLFIVTSIVAAAIIGKKDCDR